jgi:purine-cytosine permease-like protein
MSTFLWVMLAVLYVTLVVAFGISTLRKGHYVLFILGIFLPLLWIVGALMGPTEDAAAAEAQTRLQH